MANLGEGGGLEQEGAVVVSIVSQPNESVGLDRLADCIYKIPVLDSEGKNGLSRDASGFCDTFCLI